MIPAQQRLTLYANDIPELAGHDFSTIVTTAAGMVAERVMYWRQIGGGNTRRGLAGPRARGPRRFPALGWVFAEGAPLPGFDTFYLLLNPNPFAITVRVCSCLESGAPVARPTGAGPHPAHGVT